MPTDELHIDFTNGWYACYKLGKWILNLTDTLVGWFNTEITLPVLGYDGEHWFPTSFISLSLIDMIIGSGILFLLGFKLVKWITDLVL